LEILGGVADIQSVGNDDRREVIEELAMPNILLIFDIDGTLTFSDGATSRAMKAVFQEMTGVPEGTKGVVMQGMTDAYIFRQMLGNAGIALERFPEMFREFQPRYFRAMKDELANAAKARLLPGVRDLLNCLATDNRFALALGSGNLEVSGREKLRIHHADHYFPVGGFGSDAEERVDVLKAAVEKARKHWNTEFQPSNTWVIGDTSKDVMAGKAIGARTIAVATGAYSMEELLESEPDVVLETLEDRELFLDVVMSSQQGG
jgi:phosphoglycolate phosphatase-like HAD superfamily hydrolase